MAECGEGGADKGIPAAAGARAVATENKARTREGDVLTLEGLLQVEPIRPEAVQEKIRTATDKSRKSRSRAIHLAFGTWPIKESFCRTCDEDKLVSGEILNVSLLPCASIAVSAR